MNYRHAYHAGNVADVMKHVTLLQLVRYLQQKPAPLLILDSHAGIGDYDLTSAPATATGEAAWGVQMLAKLAHAPALLAEYMAAMNNANAGQKPWHFYPGSCRLLQQCLRQQDRLVLLEKHPEDFVTLRQRLGSHPQTACHQRDAYEGLTALLPPAEKRGLVLIDPPYEAPNEWAKLQATLAILARRWPQGVYAIWYPIKDQILVAQQLEQIAGQGWPNALCLEFIYQDLALSSRLNGSGLLVLNPPWQLDEWARACWPILHDALNLPDFGSHATWLRQT